MKPKILITRAIFPEVIERLQAYADLETNQEDLLFSS